jgi:hypothetical protein
MAHGPRDLNTLYKRMRAVSGYLRQDAAATRVGGGRAREAPGGHNGGSGEKVPTESPQGARGRPAKSMAREGIEPPTRGFSVRCSTN